MAAATHTPGPWKWVEDKHYPTTDLVGADGTPVLQIYESHGGGRMPENNADARLIAAAPDMLAALELALPIIGDRAAGGRMLTPHQHAADAFQKINAVIARATGGDF